MEELGVSPCVRSTILNTIEVIINEGDEMYSIRKLEKAFTKELKKQYMPDVVGVYVSISEIRLTILSPKEYVLQCSGTYGREDTYVTNKPLDSWKSFTIYFEESDSLDYLCGKFAQFLENEDELI